jgi:(E)-4-hydroxy-3-methylbut-2-enyl-diphosphate synthase
MTNTDPLDVAATLAQIERVARRGAELVRLAVPNEKAGEVLPEIVSASKVPVVADIHFDWRLATLALKAKVAGLRLNPGNIRDPHKIQKVAEAAGAAGVAIRVGVNAGSLDPEIISQYGHGAEGLVQSALKEIALLEAINFNNIIVSIKASSVNLTVEAVKLFAKLSDYPQHLGITEAGDLKTGVVKSAVGLGILLSQGLGDTIRVSLTGPPEEEVDCAWEILKALKLRARGPEYVSCPTCGRSRLNPLPLITELRARLLDLTTPLTIAVMGCEVNGPGEAKMADLGVTGAASGQGAVYFKGRILGHYPLEAIPELLAAKARLWGQAESEGQS